MTAVPIPDLVGLAWFFSIWVGYTVYADRYATRERSLRAAMHRHRVVWMRQMLARDNRLVDASILGNLAQNVSFFASTTLIILAGLMTLLGAGDKAIVLIRDVPFVTKTSLVLWELKLLVLIVIFVHAFFKFTWGLRQYNYCSVLIGAAPAPSPEGGHEAYLRSAAAVATQASRDFNQGLRAYYFSLAALAWFLNPWVFMLAATAVVVVLYIREYRSHTLRLLEMGSAEYGQPVPVGRAESPRPPQPR